ncbi:hypothetical protein GLOTRDRAFT_42071 [Gloeophyllum trabeum ATCC 11539]|uniref:Uncharacterized protein n=1 Tax=Gloeophyllum trabeum (strain ATCC 11539 / FP-39264 / Madison 617) TaxID=670483 RepID=S7RKZ4_GLOTA|nr:uncharacterized protein GLOTRDRAFT_42071 [Gloeophyllum trabeum ATCC 11539]EPQ55020.1 hypothetical protein GLOTRDRAFT_42071 [Gloeophyllum trabeum ATCC 11539]
MSPRSRVGSFFWKTSWAYRPAMVTGLVSMLVYIALSLGKLFMSENWMKQHKQYTGAQKERIEEAARWKGITFEEAIEKKRGFRYLY